MSLKEIRAGRSPMWVQRSPKHHGSLFWMGKFVSPVVRCEEHLPIESKIALLATKGRYDTEEWWPPQEFFDGKVTWSDNIVTEIYTFNGNGDPVLHKDTRPCGICAFKAGLEKLRKIIYQRRVFEALEENWLRPRENGYAPYAQWS